MGSMTQIPRWKMKRAMRVMKETWMKKLGIMQITLIRTLGMNFLFWLSQQQPTKVPYLPLHTLCLPHPFLLMPQHNHVYLMKREESPEGALKEIPPVVWNWPPPLSTTQNYTSCSQTCSLQVSKSMSHLSQADPADSVDG